MTNTSPAGHAAVPAGAGWQLVPVGDPTPLSECPPGPFDFNGGLGFKTEYGAAKWLPERDAFTVSHWPDPYCLVSGEAFWGGVSGQEARAALVVQPLAAAPKVASDTGAGLAWRLERIRDDNLQLTASDRAFLTEAAAALVTVATGLVADLRKAIDDLNDGDRDREKIDVTLTALLKRIYHTDSAAGRLIGRLDVERACELAAQVAEREQRYEGSDFPVCRGIAAEIRLIPAKMWAEG